MRGGVATAAAAKGLVWTRQIRRARYLRERRDLELAGASAACFEEAEAAVALAERVLRELGTDDATVARETGNVRRVLARAGPRPLASVRDLGAEPRGLRAGGRGVAADRSPEPGALHLATFVLARRETEALQLLTADDRLREAAGTA